MVSVPSSLGEWIHSPWVDRTWCGKGTQSAPGACRGHASAWFLPFDVALHREPKGTKRFSHWEIPEKFASRVLHQQPAHHVPEATLQQNLQDHDFPRSHRNL